MKTKLSRIITSIKTLTYQGVPRSLWICLAVGLCASAAAPTQPLITGKAITPSTQTSSDVGNMPMNIAVTPDGRYALVSDMGYHQWLWSIRTSDGKGVSKVSFERINPKHWVRIRSGGEESGTPASPGSWQSNGLYYGLAIGKGNVVYAAQGAHDSIAVLDLGDDGTLKLRDYIVTRQRDFPAGLAMDDRDVLYVANNASGNGDPTKLSGSVAMYDPDTKMELGRYTFSNSHGGTSNFPLGIVALRNGETAYVAAERDDMVYALDTRDPATPTLRAGIGVRAHPATLALSPDQTRLFVANSLSDTVSVIDTQSNKVVGTILLRPDMVRDLPGVTPTALTVSADGETLYVTLGDMDAIGVVDVASMQLRMHSGGLVSQRGGNNRSGPAARRQCQGHQRSQSQQSARPARCAAKNGLHPERFERQRLYR